MTWHKRHQTVARWLTALTLAASASACELDSPTPVSEGTGGPSDIDTAGKEQAETAVVLGYVPAFNIPLLSTTYNDFSIGLTFEGLDEFSYPSPNERIIRRGASLMGWATSQNPTFEVGWEYHGKVRPPRQLPHCTFDRECPSGTCLSGTCTCLTELDCHPADTCDVFTGQCFGNSCSTNADCAPGYACSESLECQQEPWAVIFGDPSMAVDELSPALVYAVQMGVSDASYNLAPGIGTTPNVEATLDGFCIARSLDGGFNLGVGSPLSGLLIGQAHCERVVPASAPTPGVGIDKTAVTVDWRGRIWVAVEDRTNGTIAIYRSQDGLENWNRFTRLGPCTGSASDPDDCIPAEEAPFIGQFEPVLRTGIACRPGVSPDCVAAPNAFGAVYLQSVRFDVDGTKTILLTSFGADFDDTIVPESCTTGADCASGICNAAGECGCSTNAHCDSKLVCNPLAQACVPRVCTTDADCSGGWVCDQFVCSQPVGWLGFDLSSYCGVSNVYNVNELLPTYGTDEPGDGTQDGSHVLRGAFRHTFDIGVDRDGVPVVRFGYLYLQSSTNRLRVQVGEIDSEGTCSTPAGWSTETFAQTVASQEFWPTLDWTERTATITTAIGSVPVQASDSALTWQLGYLSNRNVPDKSKRYVLPFGSTITTDASGAPFMDSTPLVEGNDSYLCARTSGYWGDYFGLTQYPRLRTAGSMWQNSATFTFSARRAANAGPVCTVEGSRLAQPMSVYSYHWSSTAP